MRCMRLEGHSAFTCECKHFDGTWSDCPAEAQNVYTSVFPPASYIITPEMKADTLPATPTPEPTPIEQGFTGDMCDSCGGVRMVRTGTCATCMDCGTTGGCG